jgi:hypothetical protein
MWKVTLLLFASFLGAAPRAPASKPTFRVGTIQTDTVRECSGIVASRKHPGVFWTHNDGGNSPVLYAITREGALIREYVVAAKNNDWEDIAIDDAGHLYIADTGNNNGDRKQVFVLRVDEPDPRAPMRGDPAPLRANVTWKLKFLGEPFDCESLFVLDGKGYVIAKRLNGALAEVFCFDLKPVAQPITFERLGELPGVRAPVTAADVSADGKRLAVLTVLGPYQFDLTAREIASALKTLPRHSAYIDLNMEAACFVPEGLLVANEKRDLFLFGNEHFTPGK